MSTRYKRTDWVRRLEDFTEGCSSGFRLGQWLIAGILAIFSGISRLLPVTRWLSIILTPDVPVVSTVGASSLKSPASIWRGVVFIALLVGMMAMGRGAWAEPFDDSDKGWRYVNGDMTGSNYYPHPSSFETSNELQEQFSIEGVTGNILTGDVTGDGYLEIINVSDNQLKIFSHEAKLLQTVTLGSSKASLNMIEDINGDGVSDIGIGTTWKSGSPKSYFYDGNGNLLQTLSRNGGYDSLMWPAGLLPNGNFIVGFSAGYSHANKHRGFAVFDKTGTEIWSYKVGPLMTSIPSIADFDNDGLVEFTYGGFTSHNGNRPNVINGTNTTDGDLWLIVVDEQGNEEFSIKYPSPSDGSAAHYFVDLDQNGQMEILAVEGHYPSYYRGLSQLHIYGQDGQIIHSFDGLVNTGWSAVAHADMTGDGKHEVVASNGDTHLHLLNSSLSPLKSLEISGRLKLLNDLNGDGKIEIVLLDGNGNLTVLDSEFNILDTFDVGRGGQVIASDIDKDGKVELIALTDKLRVLENVGEMTVAPATCQLYAVHDQGLNNTQFFTVSPETFEVKALGSMKKAHDIEALDIHPQTAELFAASGKDTKKPGYLYRVDKNTGQLIDIGSTGFKEIDGLSFHPDGTLWGWASGDGLVTIDSTTGKTNLVATHSGEVEDLTWNTAGTMLFGVENVQNNPDAGVKLLAYDGNTVTTVCEELTQSLEIEALDTLPDDTLIFGLHGKNGLPLGVIDVDTCQMTAETEISTDYNDVEGIAWPNCQ